MKKRFYTLTELIVVIAMIVLALTIIAGLGIIGYAGYHFLMKIL